jgi:hypothetical protein
MKGRQLAVLGMALAGYIGMLLYCPWTVETMTQAGPKPGGWCGGVWQWELATTYAWWWTDWSESQEWGQWRQYTRGYVDEERWKVQLLGWTNACLLAFLAIPRLWRRHANRPRPPLPAVQQSEAIA